MIKKVTIELEINDILYKLKVNASIQPPEPDVGIMSGYCEEVEITQVTDLNNGENLHRDNWNFSEESLEKSHNLTFEVMEQIRENEYNDYLEACENGYKGKYRGI